MNIIPIPRASQKVVKTLISIGALYVGKDGIHASRDGMYPKTRNPRTDGQSERE